MMFQNNNQNALGGIVPQLPQNNWAQLPQQQNPLGGLQQQFQQPNFMQNTQNQFALNNQQQGLNVQPQNQNFLNQGNIQQPQQGVGINFPQQQQQQGLNMQQQNQNFLNQGFMQQPQQGGGNNFLQQGGQPQPQLGGGINFQQGGVQQQAQQGGLPGVFNQNLNANFLQPNQQQGQLPQPQTPLQQQQQQTGLNQQQQFLQPVAQNANPQQQGTGKVARAVLSESEQIDFFGSKIDFDNCNLTDCIKRIHILNQYKPYNYQIKQVDSDVLKHVRKTNQQLHAFLRKQNQADPQQNSLDDAVYKRLIASGVDLQWNEQTMHREQAILKTLANQKLLLRNNSLGEREDQLRQWRKQCIQKCNVNQYIEPDQAPNQQHNFRIKLTSQSLADSFRERNQLLTNFDPSVGMHLAHLPTLAEDFENAERADIPFGQNLLHKQIVHHVKQCTNLMERYLSQTFFDKSTQPSSNASVRVLLKQLAELEENSMPNERFVEYWGILDYQLKEADLIKCFLENNASPSTNMTLLSEIVQKYITGQTLEMLESEFAQSIKDAYLKNQRFLGVGLHGLSLKAFAISDSNRVAQLEPYLAYIKQTYMTQDFAKRNIIRIQSGTCPFMAIFYVLYRAGEHELILDLCKHYMVSADSNISDSIVQTSGSINNPSSNLREFVQLFSELLGSERALRDSFSAQIGIDGGKGGVTISNQLLFSTVAKHQIIHHSAQQQGEFMQNFESLSAQHTSLVQKMIQLRQKYDQDQKKGLDIFFFQICGLISRKAENLSVELSEEQTNDYLWSQLKCVDIADATRLSQFQQNSDVQQSIKVNINQASSFPNSHSVNRGENNINIINNNMTSFTSGSTLESLQDKVTDIKDDRYQLIKCLLCTQHYGKLLQVFSQLTGKDLISATHIAIVLCETGLISQCKANSNNTSNATYVQFTQLILHFVDQIASEDIRALLYLRYALPECLPNSFTKFVSLKQAPLFPALIELLVDTIQKHRLQEKIFFTQQATLFNQETQLQPHESMYMVLVAAFGKELMEQVTLKISSQQMDRLFSIQCFDNIHDYDNAMKQVCQALGRIYAKDASLYNANDEFTESGLENYVVKYQNAKQASTLYDSYVKCIEILKVNKKTRQILQEACIPKQDDFDMILTTLASMLPIYGKEEQIAEDAYNASKEMGIAINYWQALYAMLKTVICNNSVNFTVDGELVDYRQMTKQMVRFCQNHKNELRDLDSGFNGKMIDQINKVNISIL